MRRILFRGKDKKSGKWVEGYYTKGFQYPDEKEPNDMIYMFSGTTSEWEFNYAIVTHETIGQYTGLTDKNGKKIFEGDIVEFLGCKYEVIFEVGSFGLVGINDWEAIARQIPVRTGCDNDLHACLNDHYISLWEISWNLENEYNELNTVKIIGNIHDNPELLEGE